jgi:hypothetical protein
MKVHQTKIEPATKLSATNIIQVLSGTVAIVTWKLDWHILVYNHCLIDTWG